MTVFVIAEGGVNHNGNRDMAFALVDAAVEAGADAIKFQAYKADLLAVAAAPKAEYQNATTAATESQLQMLRRLELSHEMHHRLFDHAVAKGIAYLSSAFDPGSLRFLVDDLRLETLKLPSGEITNGPLLLAAGKSGRKIILSTGMSTLADVEEALGVLAFGMTGQHGAPSRGAFRDALAEDAAWMELQDKVTLLHCTTEYPAPFSDINLKVMDTMHKGFGLRVGLSDHSPGIAIPIAAAALGACIIEKHFTLDRQLPGPDHMASLEPAELKHMVSGIRAVEQALGDGVKAPRPSEIKNMGIARKSLMALKPIKAGTPFTEDNLGAKRPGFGVSPMEFWTWLQKTADRDYTPDDMVGD